MKKIDVEFCERFCIDSQGRPLGRLSAITRNDGTRFVIMTMDRIPDRYWEEGDLLLPTFYAVFAKSPSRDFYQQVSRWYARYGNAVRKMGDLAKDF